MIPILKNKKPLVLVTNDDGIDSPGLLALAEALVPICEVIIVAPMFQQTGMGRGALNGDFVGTIKKKGFIIDNQLIEGYSVYGSPAQSVAHGLLELLPQKPDFCVSGINYGENLGLALTCSGTVGAILEADSFGIPGIAFSRSIPMKDQKSEDFMTLDWSIEKFHVLQIMRNIITHGMPNQVHLLNVNFPKELTETTEIRVTRQGHMNYGAYIHPGERDFNLELHLGWQLSEHLHKAPEDTDIYAVHFDKVISVTPMTSLMSVNLDRYYGE